MIRVAAYFTQKDCGAVMPAGESFTQSAPKLSSTDEVLALVARPVKHFPRMTAEARGALVAGAIAMKSADWNDSASREVGIVAAGYEATLAANTAYFRDFVASGRNMGRGNLFIYTLPTSTLGELAIALHLNGPTLHIHDDAAPLAALVRHAHELLADGEADAMLALWSDPSAAVCLAIDGDDAESFELPEFPPLELANHLHALAVR